MGASHSAGQPRSVNLDNQTPIGVMDISDEVVHRLKNSLAEDNQRTNASSTSPQPPASAAKQDQQQQQQQQQQQIPTQTRTTVQTLYNEPSISAIEVRRQKEIELQQNDAYWRKRMSQLELTLNKTNSIMETEYLAAIEDVRKKFTNAAPIHQLPPCQELKTQLIACYRANPGETLKCNEEVIAFENCVNNNRIMKLDSAVSVDKESAGAAGGAAAAAPPAAAAAAADKKIKIPPKAA